jgi:hypothetical protein
MRIAQQGWTTIPAHTAGVTRPRQSASFTERYRGTEFDSHVEPAAARPARPDSRGRELVILWGIAIAGIASVVLVALQP